MFELLYTTYHIKSEEQVWSLAGRFFEYCVWRLQASDTEVAYNGALGHIGAKFGDRVEWYLGQIEPVKWVLFANMLSSTDLTRHRLFKCRTTNFVESDNNKTLQNKLRLSLPAQAVLI
ncbi:hypothetical protein DYB32_010877 [Aphanomyces invadans]|uniref:Uncharacterized protein n=1 Tax=Aphanomyces invadans TaxID=157072 RepID=A0A3R6V219_9STRA|nr:hypothetical protein DYB32_010877 [Aphanomyces invadans]